VRQRPWYERSVVEAAHAADEAMREHLHIGIDEATNVFVVAAT
jgi:hypothetical protein